MMEIEKKCEIMEEFMREFSNRDEVIQNVNYINFRVYNDLGLPIAQAFIYGLVELTDEGEDVINETWINFCQLLDADPNGLYESIYEIFGDSDEYQ